MISLLGLRIDITKHLWSSPYRKYGCFCHVRISLHFITNLEENSLLSTTRCSWLHMTAPLESEDRPSEHNWLFCLKSHNYLFQFSYSPCGSPEVGSNGFSGLSTSERLIHVLFSRANERVKARPQDKEDRAVVGCVLNLEGLCGKGI